MPIIPALGRPREKDFCEFEASLGDIARPQLEKKIQKIKMNKFLFFLKVFFETGSCYIALVGLALVKQLMLALYLQKMSCVNLSARIIDICYHAQLINFFIKLSRFSYFIIGTENGLIKSPNTAEKRHTDFSFLFNPASLLIRASNPGLSDSRVLFFVMAIVSHTHPKDSCWTLLKSHAHSFKALC